MPQDKRRTISYRSFVTCDDPKGVECGVIRKSKVNSSKKEQDNSCNKVEVDRKQRNQATSVEVEVGAINNKEERDKKKEMGIRGITRARLETPASKEVEKLNHVINSWSYDKSLKENNQNYIAKDLLRGAYDLQESLVMLEKLQEASGYMLGLSRKQKQKLDEGTFDGMVGGVRGVQRPSSFGVDECPRKSCDGMRNAVRDSLLRHNMITNPVFEEHYDHRKMASPDMLPSTSSSQSSMMYSSNFVPSDSSISSPASQRKNGRKSNVIVKLMGLESFPTSPRRLSEAKREKNLNLTKPVYDIGSQRIKMPVYDIGSPRIKMPQFFDQEEGMKQKSVEEILENLKFRGLLRYSSVNDLTISSPESEVFASKNCWVDEKPPIVLMKPLRYPCIDLDWPFMSKSRGETVMKPRSSRVGSTQENVAKESVKSSEVENEKTSDCEAKAKSLKKVASPKPQRKQAEVRKASEVEKAPPIRRKGAKSGEQLSSRDQEKVTTSKMVRHKDGKSTSKNQTFSQQKVVSTPKLDHKKRGISEERKNRLPALVQYKDENKESEAVYKEVIDSAIDNRFGFPTVDNIIGDKNASERCPIQIREYDLDSQAKVLNASEETPKLRDEKKISHDDDNLSSYSEITSVSTTEYCNVDRLNEARSPIHEVTLITTHENGVEVHHDTNQEENASFENENFRQSLTPRMKLKALLLSNSSFVTHVEELFNIQVNPDFVPFVVDDSDQDLESTRLLIDCAIEILELESLQYSQACLPLARVYSARSRISVSLDRLLEEVCNRIEDLRPSSDDQLPSDNPYVLLDQDLRTKSGTWGYGWRYMFTEDEVEQVIGEIDKSVLGKLVEEVLSDFML